jgi:hypothetical protein
MDLDDPIERGKWLARLVASAKGHARKAGRPFELTTEFIETLRPAARALRRYRASIQPASLPRCPRQAPLRAKHRSQVIERRVYEG